MVAGVGYTCPTMNTEGKDETPWDINFNEQCIVAQQRLIGG